MRRLSRHRSYCARARPLPSLTRIHRRNTRHSFSDREITKIGPKNQVNLRFSGTSPPIIWRVRQNFDSIFLDPKNCPPESTKKNISEMLFANIFFCGIAGKIPNAPQISEKHDFRDDRQHRQTGRDSQKTKGLWYPSLPRRAAGREPEF